MLNHLFRVQVLSLAFVGILGCSQEDGPIAPAVPASPAAGEHNYRLVAQPPGAKGVIDVRKTAQADEEVVIVGHVAGSEEPIVKGRAAFTIVDLTLEPCEEDRPWVYCCTPRDELLAAMVLVKCVDDEGKTITQDARHLLGIKEWSTVVVRGHARRGADGNLTSIEATGIYVRP